MSASLSIEDQIAVRYRGGESTGDIARALNLRLAAVLDFVRTLNLRAPAAQRPMETIRSLTALFAVDVAPAAPATSTPAPQAGAEPAAVRSPVRVPRDTRRRDLDEDEDGPLVRKKGCPRGWLLSEAEVNRAYATSGRYEDVVLKRRIVPSAQGQRGGTSLR